MDLKPVDEYRRPEYRSYTLKNGLKLSAGVAATAMLAGMLGGCTLIEKIHPIEVTAGVPAPTIDVLDGYVPTPTESTEVLLGAFPAPTADIDMVPGEFPEPTTSIDVLDGRMPAPTPYIDVLDGEFASADYGEPNPLA